MSERRPTQRPSRRKQSPKFRPKLVGPRLWQVFYLLAATCLAMIVLLYVHLVFQQTLLTILFMALFLLTLRTWTAAIFLIIVQVSLGYLESGDPEAFNPFLSTLWVSVTVGLVAAISRYRTLQQRDRMSALKNIPDMVRALRDDSPKAKMIVGNALMVAGSLLRVVFLLSLSALLAAYLMAMVPLPELSYSRSFGFKPYAYRAIMLGLLLFVLFLPCWLLVNEITWRRFSPRQAGMYLRSVMLGWIHRDLRNVVNRRLKLRRAQQTATRRQKPKPVPSDSQGDD